MSLFVYNDMAGYSKKTLTEKLGIKKGKRVLFINFPYDYFSFLGDLSDDIYVCQKLVKNIDFVQLFTTTKSSLQQAFSEIRTNLSKNGVLWVSWPKKASNVESDLNENIIRDIGLKNGMVDVKVIAVDDVWSSLKFVYRLKDRKTV